MKGQKDGGVNRAVLLLITPIGVAIGLYEAWHLAGRLVFLLALQFIALIALVWVLVRTVRRESRQNND